MIKLLKEYLYEFLDYGDDYRKAIDNTLNYLEKIKSIVPDIAAPNSCPFDDGKGIELLWDFDEYVLDIAVLCDNEVEIYYRNKDKVWYEEVDINDDFLIEFIDILKSFSSKEKKMSCNHNKIRPDKCFCPENCECKTVGIGMCYDIMKIYQPIITAEQKVFKKIARDIKEILSILKDNNYYEEYIVEDGKMSNGNISLFSNEILDSLEKDVEYLLEKAGK